MNAKEKWQIEAKKKLLTKGMTYADLAKEINVSEPMIRQAMSVPGYVGTKQAICEYLGIKIKS